MVTLATGSLSFNQGSIYFDVRSDPNGASVDVSLQDEGDQNKQSIKECESNKTAEFPPSPNAGKSELLDDGNSAASEHPPRFEGFEVAFIGQKTMMPDSDDDDESDTDQDSVTRKPGSNRRCSYMYICIGILGIALVAAGIGIGVGTARNSSLALLVTLSPSASPSVSPSAAPSESPSHPPSPAPSEQPSDCPTIQPSAAPSNSPSTAPSSEPSAVPSGKPSEVPSVSPSEMPSGTPSTSPSTSPSTTPSAMPSASPSSSPTSFPTMNPTLSSAPSASPTPAPTALPSSSVSPSRCPSEVPSTSPTISSQPTAIPATFVPGNLTRLEAGLLLSEGLRAKILATSGQPVVYADGNVSDAVFHGRPDFGATFPDTRSGNEGGWVYTSNSEMEQQGQGGVGSLTFDSKGNVIDYKMVLEGTTMNCGGGRTPWNTWVSCEEIEFSGLIYQVDPFGNREAAPMTIGMETGRWESFAYDVRNQEVPRFFATEDHNKGTVRRFTPGIANWDDPWEMLHAEGVVDYLIVHPNEAKTGGTFEWTRDIEVAKNNARMYYPQSEGIDVFGHEMYVVCKRIKQMFTFNLDTMTYFNQSTVTGLFDGGPDQMQRIVGHSGDLLFFTEEGGRDAGIHARDSEGRFYTILESPEYTDETTGLAFSPDGTHMYVAYQASGLLFDVWRDDGLPFQARTLNVKYHQASQG